MGYRLLVLVLMTLVGCASNVKRSWGDDYSQGKWRGGVVEYPRGETKEARQKMLRKAERQARKLCGKQREPSVSVMPPVQRLEQKTSFFLGSYLEYEWHEPYLYMCTDSDPVAEAYRISLSPSPRCEQVVDHLRPGRARIAALMDVPSTQMHDGAGWMRYLGPNGGKYYFFGQTGLATCRRMVAELASDEVDDGKLDRWLLEHLPLLSP